MATGEKSGKDKFVEILRANGIQEEIADFTISKPDLTGEHLSSIIDSVRFEFLPQTKREPLQLFVKRKLPRRSLPEDHPVNQITANEGRFLQDFVQEMKEFRASKAGGPDVSDLFPKVYYCDENMIVMEDLTQRGFRTLPKAVKRNFEETRIIFEHLARYHALTHVMISSVGGPEQFEESHPFLKEFSADSMAKNFEPAFKYCIEILKGSNHKEKDDVVPLLEKYVGNLLEAFTGCVESKTNFISATHGDCWNNNVMFDVETRQKVILLDLQAPRINSPTMDLARFFFFSVASDARKRWKEILQIYYETVKGHVLAMEHPFPFTFEDFIEDLSVKGKMDFLCAFLVVIGMEAIADVDPSDLKGDIGRGIVGILTHWVTKNPDKLDWVAQTMVEMTQDFLLFGQL